MAGHIPSAAPLQPESSPSDDLRQDHGLLLDLLRRFEHTDDCGERRSLMQAVIDLFEVHVALESQMVAEGSWRLARECQAIYELMDRMEATDPRSRLHYLGGIELMQMLERYAARCRASQMLRPAAPPQAGGCRSGLLRERSQLVAYARQLVRTH
jgi:hypothetical protein